MKTTLLLMIMFCAFSCKCKIQDHNISNTKMENNNIATQDYIVISKGNLYGSGAEGIEDQNLVITNENDWNELIAKMDSVNKVSDSFSETEIDFSKYSLIAVFDTVKGSGGHSLEIDVKPNSENIEVHVSRKSPEGMATTVMTQPYVIVKIAKSELPIVFK